MERRIISCKPLFLLLLILVWQANGINAQGNLSISVTDIRTVKGQILYSLYNQEIGFPDDPSRAFRRGSMAVNAKQMNLVISNLPAGFYALSLIHDENGNSHLDKNKMGIPTEGVAFSNNAMGAFGPPKYLRARFQVKNDSVNAQTIRLRKFQ